MGWFTHRLSLRCIVGFGLVIKLLWHIAKLYSQGPIMTTSHIDENLAVPAGASAK